MSATCTTVVTRSNRTPSKSATRTMMKLTAAPSSSQIGGDLTPVKNVRSVEQGGCSATPPLASAITGMDSSKMISMRSPKKQSPVSAMRFPDEEMKVSHAEDEHDYRDSLVHVVHKFVPPPLSSRLVDSNNNYKVSYEEQPASAKEKKAISPPQAKPPLRPEPKRLSAQSTSDPMHRGDVSDDTSQGEKAMMALAEDCLQNRDYTTALALYKSLFFELDRAYGRNHGQVALCLHKIGESHLFLGNFEKSIKYLETAISIRSELREDELELANSMDRLAVAKLHLNEVDDAHAIYRQALRIKRSLLGLYHADVAHISTQLGCIYFYSGEVLSAQASFEDALFVYRHLACNTGGSTWMIKASDALCSIGSIKLAQKNYSRSVGYFAEALNAQKQVYGIYHPVVITTLDNLGFAHTKSKNYVVASEVYEEMLHAQVIYYRGYNLDCYQSLKKLNVVYEKMDKLYAAIDATQEAISQQKRSLSFDSKVFRKTHSMLERLEAKLEEIEKLRPITC